MFLSDLDIKAYMDKKQIVVEPTVNPKDFRQGGIRVHLSNIIYELNETDYVVDLRNPNISENGFLLKNLYKKIDLNDFEADGTPYTLRPKRSVIGSTVESFILPDNMFILLDGRSTIARFGITNNISAAVVDNLHLASPKSITLELFNCGSFNFVLYTNLPIGMVLFGLLSSSSVTKPSEQYIERQVVPNLKYIHENEIL